MADSTPARAASPAGRLSLSRRANLALLLLALGYTALVGLTLSPQLNDFEFYRRAAQAMLQTGDPYSARAGYIYPPLLAELLQPFGALATRPAQAAWFGANLLLCGGVLALCLRLSPSAATRGAWGLVALGFALFPPLRLTLQLGQISGLIALLLLAVVALAGERPRLAGLCLALASCLKLYPALLGLYYLLERPRGVAWWALAFGLAIVALTLGLYGPQPYLSYLTWALPNEVVPYAAEFNISIVGFWSRLLTANRYALALADLPRLAQALIGLSSAAALALCAWGQGRAAGPLGRQLRAGLWLCAMLLLSPVNGYYNLLLLLFPALALLRALEQSPDPRLRAWLIGATILICVPPTWAARLPALDQALHSGWGLLLLTPSFYGLWAYLLLLALALRRHSPPLG